MKYTATIKKIKAVLSPDSREVSSLLKILSEQERIKLESYFQRPERSATQQEWDDLGMKFLALNSLLIYIKNNPSVEKALLADEVNAETISLKAYEAAYALFCEDKTWLHYFYVQAYAVLADKVTYLDFENDCGVIARPVDFLDKLLHFFIMLNVPIKSNSEFEEREVLAEQLKDELLHLHEQEDVVSQSDLVEIVALSNLVSLATDVQKYLLQGSVQNIPTKINSLTANAMKVFSYANNRQWELISSLLRFVLLRCYEQSVWGVANRQPFVKEFVERQIQNETILLSLFPTQEKGLNYILASRKCTVVSMPTSSGKTLLAELKILYTKKQTGENFLAVYVVPTNALINQTCKRLKSSLPGLRIGQLLPYNHFNDFEKQLIDENSDVLVTTPEKFSYLLRNDEHNLLNNLCLVIIDEAHNIGLDGRGAVWEFLLANLKQNDERISYLLLTPFIKNSQQISEWIDPSASDPFVSEWTPTKQYTAYHSLHKGKSVSKINYIPSARDVTVKQDVSIDLGIDPQSRKEAIGQDTVNDIVRNSILVEKFRNLDGCVLILTRGVGTAEKLAYGLAGRSSSATTNEVVRDKISRAKILIGLEMGEDHLLLSLLDKGIAFHHARLTPLVKEIIEDLVTDGAINLLVATTTLAQGMNFPIKTVIFDTLSVGGGAEIRNLTHCEFWNIAGRAGRAYQHTEGHIVVGYHMPTKTRPRTSREELEKFVMHDIDTIISSLTKFFKEIKGGVTIDYQFIKDNRIAQSLLHYLNHLLNISYDYNLSSINRTELENILVNTLYYKQQEAEEGFIEARELIVDFSSQYFDLIRSKDVKELKLADALGITDISLSTIRGLAQEHSEKLSDCVMQGNVTELAKAIHAINLIPELRLSMELGVKFQPELIAGILLQWINGWTIKQISQSNRISVNDCSKYVYSNLKNFMPWGIAIYQKISNDDNHLLPSYAFYGVKDEQSVKLSYIGVPRFALKDVKASIKDLELYSNMDRLREFVKGNSLELKGEAQHNQIVRDLIKKSVV